MSEDLDRILARVVDESTFVAFVHALGLDRAAEVEEDRDLARSPWEPGSRGWENGTIDTFLNAAAAWAADSSTPDEICAMNPWRRCADVLFAGKHYE